jgi:alcohol dehydrogenase (cytochrome c)
VPSFASDPDAIAGDWPNYNRTHTSERYSQLSLINTKNVGKLKVLCTYDVKQFAAFESGLIMVESALIGTTERALVTQEEPPPRFLCHEQEGHRG